MAQEKPELDRELSEIRKEVIESRNLVIKTDNLLKNLHAELKMVGKRQEDFQKHLWISAGAAYVMFTALAVGGAVVASSYRTAAANDERQRLETQVAEVTQREEKARVEAQAVLSAQKAAGDVYKMMTTLPGDDRLKGVDQLVKLDTTKLSALERQALSDKAEVLRKEIGQGAFERGKAAFRRNELSASVTELNRFLALNPEKADLLEASFFIGVAYNQLRKHDQAVAPLARFVNEDRRSKQREYAMLLLAQSYQETDQGEKALQTARDALGTYPAGEYQAQFKQRISSVKRSQAEGADPAAAPAAAPPAAVAPAPAAPVAPVAAPPKPAAPAAGAPAPKPNG